jgi:molecular chaperone DnaJ
VSAQGFLRIRTVCPTCRGEGRITKPEDRCPTCLGAGKIRESGELEVRIPPGSYGGLQVRHSGAGEAGDPGGDPGDLYVTLDVEPHEVFKRDGADVYVTVPVPYEIMCLGGRIQVPTVHGEQELDVARGTTSGHVSILRGKGVEVIRGGGQKGDEHVRLVVDVPKSVAEEEEVLLRQLAELRGRSVKEKGFWEKVIGKLGG